ncbi:MAG: hypothetical protein R2817_12705 [Flavobacteriales bacterium]
MEREQLDRLIRTPHAVEQQDMAALRELSERAPWFAGAQLLRTVGERASGDVRSDSGLQRAAAHIPSRAVLYDLVERPLRAAEERRSAPMHVVPQEPGATPAAMPPVADIPPPTASVANEQHSAEPVIPPVQAEVTAVIPEVAEPAPVPQVIAANESDHPAVDEDPAPTAAALLAAEDPLERQILESALASVYDLTLHAPPPRSVQPAEEPPTSAMDPVPVPMTAAKEAARPTPIPEPVPATRSVARPVNGRLRFTSWLNDTAPEAAPAPPAKLAAAPAPAKEEASVGPEHSPAPTTVSGASTKPTAPVEVSSLIDRFIQQETPAPTKKATFFTPQQAAKKSLDDSAGLVTETLARIYEKQGNLQKAIDAYRKLALKYPEKSAYFAALSRSLEEQLNT